MTSHSRTEHNDDEGLPSKMLGIRFSISGFSMVSLSTMASDTTSAMIKEMTMVKMTAMNSKKASCRAVCLLSTVADGDSTW